VRISMEEDRRWGSVRSQRACQALQAVPEALTEHDHCPATHCGRQPPGSGSGQAHRDWRSLISPRSSQRNARLRRRRPACMFSRTTQGHRQHGQGEHSQFHGHDFVPEAKQTKQASKTSTSVLPRRGNNDRKGRGGRREAGQEKTDRGTRVGYEGKERSAFRPNTGAFWLFIQSPSGSCAVCGKLVSPDHFC
jgi:hypothetical protein